MVVKTEVCNFSELKIYPGKGVKIITRESKIVTYLNKKSRVLGRKKVRPQKIKWTTAWRRLNKKIQNTNQRKRKKRRAQKIIREIQGMDLETITRKKKETKNDRNLLRQKAIQEIKERRQQKRKNRRR